MTIYLGNNKLGIIYTGDTKTNLIELGTTRVFGNGALLPEQWEPMFQDNTNSDFDDNFNSSVGDAGSNLANIYKQSTPLGLYFFNRGTSSYGYVRLISGNIPPGDYRVKVCSIRIPTRSHLLRFDVGKNNNNAFGTYEVNAPVSEETATDEFWTDWYNFNIPSTTSLFSIVCYSNTGIDNCCIRKIYFDRKIEV